MPSHASPTESNTISQRDAHLLARVRAGDESAFEALHAAYHDRLWRFAHDQVRSPEAAEEIVQEVFLALWRKRAAWEISTSIAGWLYGAVRHHALRHFQRERSTARCTDRAAQAARGAVGRDGPTSDDALCVAMGAPPPDAHDALEARELDDAVMHALSTLPERRRIAMTLRWKHQLTAPEIASVLDTTPEAVRVLLTRARQELGALLDHGRT